MVSPTYVITHLHNHTYAKALFYCSSNLRIIAASMSSLIIIAQIVLERSVDLACCGPRLAISEILLTNMATDEDE